MARSAAHKRLNKWCNDRNRQVRAMRHNAPSVNRAVPVQEFGRPPQDPMRNLAAMLGLRAW